MTNKEASARFEKLNSSTIDTLIWLASKEIEDEKAMELIETMGKEDFDKCFPDIGQNYDYDELSPEEILQLLFDHNKLGFLAEIHIPECDNFKFDGDQPVRWRVLRGISNVRVVYAETPDDLLAEIEKASAELFKEYVDLAKSEEA